MQTIGRELIGLQIVAGTVVLLDDIAAGFNEGKKRGQTGNQIGADIERPHADHHRIEILQPVRRQIFAVKHRHVITHLFDGFGHGVARAGNVADFLSPNRQVEADGLHHRNRLEQLPGNVRVGNLLALITVTHAADFRTGGDFCGRGQLWRSDGEIKSLSVADGTKTERLFRRGNSPAGGRFQLQRASGIRTRRDNIHSHQL